MASAAFIEPLPVLEFVAQLLGKDVLSRPLSDADRVKVLLCYPQNTFPASLSFHEYNLTWTIKQIKKALRGVKVEVTHRGNVRRKYRVSGLTSQPTRELV